MGLISSLRNFLSRVPIFFIMVLWIYIRCSQLEKSVEDFRDKVSRSLEFCGVDEDVISYLLKDPFIPFSILLLSELIFCVLGLFGSLLGTWMCGIHFAFTSFLYFNPMLPENRFDILKLDIRPDMIESVGIIVCFMLVAYYPYSLSNINYHFVESIHNDDEKADYDDDELLESKQTKTHSKSKHQKKHKNK